MSEIIMPGGNDGLVLPPDVAAELEAEKADMVDKARQLPDPVGWKILCAVPQAEDTFEGSSIVMSDAMRKQEEIDKLNATVNQALKQPEVRQQWGKQGAVPMIMTTAEFDKYLHDELDLVREASNATQLRRNMAGLNLVLIPEMIWEYCTRDVIVMERMHGIPISQVDVLRKAGVDIPKLARDGVTIFFTQVFRDGFFHADMHPGNIQVSVAPATFGQYVSLDFGIVGTLTEFDKEYLAQNFTAFFRRDYKRVAELHIESGWVPPQTRVDELESAIRAVCEPYFDRPLREISLGMVLMRLFQTSRRFQVEIQPQLVLLQKTLLNIEGLGRQLDPELDLWSTAKPFLEKWMLEQVGPQRLWKQLKDEAPRLAKMLPELPRLMHAFLQRDPNQERRQWLALIQAQQRSLRILQAMLLLALGFFAGMVLTTLFGVWSLVG